MAYVPYKHVQYYGVTPDFALPGVVATTTSATTVADVQTIYPDPTLDLEIVAPGPGFHSMQAAVPAEQRPALREKAKDWK